MHPTVRALLAFVFVASLVIFSAASHAQTNVWVGPAVGDWDDPANWALGVVPDDTTSVQIDTNAGQDSSVLLEGIFSIGSLAIDSGDTLTISDDATLAVGPVLNSGSIHLVGHNQSPFPSNGLRAVGTLINAPGGLLSLDNGYYSSFSSNRNYLFWNQSLTEGYGTIGNRNIQNDGLIDANVSGDPQWRLSLDGSFSSSFNNTRFLRNSGTLRASNGGTLQLLNWSAGGILNQDDGQAGTIEALGDSTVFIQNTTISDGRIVTSTEGGVEEGQIILSGQLSLERVELDAAASFSPFVQKSLANSTFANKKTLSLDRGSLLTIGTNVLSGGGVFKLSGNASVRAPLGDSATPKFVNVDNKVLVSQNSLVTFGEEMLVENHGTFEANGQNASLTLSMNFSDDALEQWTNTGIIRAVNGGRIIFGSFGSEPAFNNTGGILEVDTASTLDLRFSHIRGGILRGLATQPVSNHWFSGFATLEDVRLEGIINWSDNLYVVGNLENTGSLATRDPLVLASEEVTVTGGGELSLQTVESNSSNNFVPKFINVDNTLLMTEFNTDFDEVTFVNRGTVETSTPNINSQLSISFNSFPSPNLINSGVIRAIDGASLNIDSNFQIQNFEVDALGNITQGKIQAGTGSEIRLIAVSGGILQADAGGVIHVENTGFLSSQNSPTDLHLLGRVEAEYIGLAGTIRNDGQLVISGDINNTGRSARFSSPAVTLLGNGELQLNGTLINRNSIFRNGPDHTITGNGAIISEGSFFTNEGRIEVKDNNTLIISHAGPGFLFQQRGELVSSGNGTLNVEFEGQFTNRGTVRIAAGAATHFIGDLSSSNHQLVNSMGAEIDVEGQLFVKNSDLVNETGGTVRGSGKIEMVPALLENPRFINNGTLSPGDTVGQLTILGDFEQSATGNLEIELGGTTSEEFDSLAAWSADLDGLLEVSLVDLGGGEFAPGLGDSFEIIELTNGQIIGEFDTFLLPALASDLVWRILYNAESVVLEILAPLQADLDFDGDVDGNDLLLVQQTDPSLIAQWQSEFGSRVISSLAAAKTVPEPASYLLMLIATQCCRRSRLNSTYRYYFYR